MSTKRSVTIFSNGIVGFADIHQLPESGDLRIALPVRRDHLADLLASIVIRGRVVITAPPRYSGRGVSESTLRIDPADVSESLYTQLSGAEIELELDGSGAGIVRGRLMGTERSPDANASHERRQRLRAFIVLLTEQGVRRFPLDHVLRLAFVSEGIHDEIDAALNRSLEGIRSEATEVALSVAAGGDSRATICYTLPGAAWKMSYRLWRREDGRFELQGHAHVDNNTAQNWQDVELAVVTGQPNTFSTDLAEHKIPQRAHVNIVAEFAAGNVVVAAGGFDDGEVLLCEEAVPAMARMRKSAEGSAGGELTRSAPAAVPEVAVTEIDDFSIFRAQERVSVPANSSIGIPIFLSELEEGQSVLLYQPQTSPDLLYRAVKFKNETGHTLCRGVCFVYLEGCYAGSNVFEVTKPGEERIVPHRIEQGVRVRRRDDSQSTDWVAVEIADGALVSRHRASTALQYDFSNQSDEEFELLIDYQQTLPGSKLHCETACGAAVRLHTLQSGARIEVRLPARSSLQLRVQEEKLLSRSFMLSSGTHVAAAADVLIEGVIKNPSPFKDEAETRRCIELLGELAAAKERLETERAQHVKMEQQRRELRSDLKALGSDSPERRALERELVELQQAARTSVEETQPALLKGIAEQTETLRLELLKLERGWSR